LDLKHVLEEANQSIPAFMSNISTSQEHLSELIEITGSKGCMYCGGLGHRIGIYIFFPNKLLKTEIQEHVLNLKITRDTLCQNSIERMYLEQVDLEENFNVNVYT